MALRQLMINKQMLSLRKELEGVENMENGFTARREALKLRSDEAEKAINELNQESTEEERGAVEATIAEIDSDAATLDDEIAQAEEKRNSIKAQIEALQNELDEINARAETPATEKRERMTNNMTTEERAMKFAETKKTSIETEELRSVLVSGGTLATPTGVSGINDKVGSMASTILDMVSVVNCVGMGSNKVAYIASDAAYAADQTEGNPAADKEPVFGYVTIQPTSIACKAQISKQAKKQSPLQYEAKVTAQALLSLRKAAVKKIVAAMKASTLKDEHTATVDAQGKGVINEKTLRNLVLAYGGDEAVEGDAVLFLNKADLIAFGDVRGTNEKLPVYEITPDGANPNTGIIRDGGMSVKYCICSELTACAGTAKGAGKTYTMFYGNPRNFELDLFSDYEVRISEDFAFTSLMDTIVGDAELGGDVVAKGGFVVETINP